MNTPAPQLSRPYVVSWNLTYRCNLACEHCYLDAGAKNKRKVFEQAFADRSELETEECFRVIDTIVDFAPECLTILTGGEPLLRKDILEIVDYAAKRKLWVVVGTNGVLISESLARTLKEHGVRGMALSLDALDAITHDRFRRVQGAWDNTVRGARVLREQGLPFIVQTTVGAHNRDALPQLADFAHQELGASVWNLYFLVQAGRGQFVSDISDSEYSEVLSLLYDIQKKYRGRMVVNAKCAPHYGTELLARDEDVEFLRVYDQDAGGCPAGTHYLGIRPNGDVTPCPYLPAYGGNLRTRTLKDIWDKSDVFLRIRDRSHLQGKCGACELNTLCGGCRARAHAMHGDVLSEDPLCSYTPGRHTEKLISLRKRVRLEYGVESAGSLIWDPEAEERMQRIPAFVRGMVRKSVEGYCRKNNLERVSLAVLEEIRARMPTPKFFAAKRPEQ